MDLESMSTEDVCDYLKGRKFRKEESLLNTAPDNIKTFTQINMILDQELDGPAIKFGLWLGHNSRAGVA